MSKPKELEQLSAYKFDGDIDTVIEMLQSIKEKYKDMKLTVDFSMEPIPYTDGDESPQFTIIGNKYEV